MILRDIYQPITNKNKQKHTDPEANIGNVKHLKRSEQSPPSEEFRSISTYSNQRFFL